jgi:hypothetical protein
MLNGLDQLWVADITYLHLAEEFGYLAVILDAFRPPRPERGAPRITPKMRLGPQIMSTQLPKDRGRHAPPELGNADHVRRKENNVLALAAVGRAQRVAMGIGEYAYRSHVFMANENRERVFAVGEFRVRARGLPNCHSGPRHLSSCDS